ncbi:sensor histidine kinase [Liquorilactobacillus satsumensis]|uniref:sensor histidine kinase n=2 Tax=Liquorilactobacillus satsumensis TaxID=259059 RepID=UPI001E4DD1BE|nr:histidine kinase [Liquorilactobacillus satsumensis]MCC7666893.1 histidine kinase [Liquorilactobacillus satsumensis]MCP9356995.1 histidine kinase [Liquorilactobacillus satsumensis]MCP9370942.1 histidine kinase [Liquorilactobacillus satsumensis]
MKAQINRLKIKDNFFVRGKWLILLWICFNYIFSLYLSYPKIAEATYMAGFIVFLHLITVLKARQLLQLWGDWAIKVILTFQIVLTFSMGLLMLKNETSAFSFLVGFIPVIVIEEITFGNDKKIVTPFALGYSVVTLGTGSLTKSLATEFFMFQAIVALIFVSKYYYSLIYNNHKKNAELQRLNTELSDAYKEVTRLTTQAVKQKIARDLHDTLVQDLIGINLQLATIDNYLKNKNFADAIRRLENTQKLTQEAITTSRKTITEYRQMQAKNVKIILRDKVVEKVQLLKARYGLDTSVHIAAELELPGELLTDVLRMINEALVNVIKHANISKATVTAQIVHEKKLVIKIMNNGIPFPEKYQQRHDHYGLIGMRERAKAHGGDLKIWSTPEEGTIVLIEVALTQ